MSIMPFRGTCFHCGHNHGRFGPVSPDDKRFLIANNELRAQVEAISLECVQLRNQLPAWIPCSAMMPKERRLVLVWLPNILCTFTAYFEDGAWRCAFSHDLLRHLEVTHWMPLPEGPK